MNHQVIGPEEAFFPFHSDAVNGDDEVDESDDSGLALGGRLGHDEEEGHLRIEDFIVFNDVDSEDEADASSGGATLMHGEGGWNETGDESAAVGDLASTPSRPRTAASSFSANSDMSMDLHPLLSHFDTNANAVGAFRRNQINQQLIFSERATQESLAFSGPYHYGTLKGIKSNSMANVSAPITPVRRQKRSGMGGFGAMGHVNVSPSLSVSQKRKASSALDFDHKRHRSISDLDVLQI
jgi:hypothetical protein